MAAPIYIPTNFVQRFPFPIWHFCPQLLKLLMMAILTDVMWYLMACCFGLIVCISLAISDAEHLFMCLLFLCLLLKNVFSHLLPILNNKICKQLFVSFFILTELYELFIYICLCNLDINLLLDMPFASIFSHSVGYLFMFWMVSFAVQNF